MRQTRRKEEKERQADSEVEDLASLSIYMKPTGKH